jgi:hypothetical protein
MLEDFFLFEYDFTHYDGQVSLAIASDKETIDEIKLLAKRYVFVDSLIIGKDEYDDIEYCPIGCGIDGELVKDFCDNFFISEHMLIIAMPDYAGFLSILVHHDIMCPDEAKEFLDTYSDCLC